MEQIMSFTFNTGRLYTKDGQVIEVVVKTTDDPEWFLVRFCDLSRMIDGEIDLFCFEEDELSEVYVQGSVMHAYDNNMYRSV